MNAQFPHPFSKFAENYRELRRQLPKQVTDIAVDEFKGNFKVGGYRGTIGTTFWKERKKQKGNQGRGILIQSGRLRRGIRPQPSFDTARVVNDVPYAKAHNEGYKGTVNVRAHNRRNFTTTKQGTGQFSIKTKKEGTKKVKSQTSVSKVRLHTRAMNMPARPFMVTGSALLNNIDKHIINKLTTLFDNVKP